MKAFRPAEPAALRQAKEVRIQPAVNSEPPSKPIVWVVVTADGKVYVRSWLGARGKWYQRLKRDPRATLHVGQLKVAVRARPVRSEAVNKRVDAAYQLKYGKRSPGSTEEMLAPTARRTTLQLVPA